MLLKNKSWLHAVFKNYCDYTYAFEKKSGRKFFKKNHRNVLHAGSGGSSSSGGGGGGGGGEHKEVEDEHCEDEQLEEDGERELEKNTIGVGKKSAKKTKKKKHHFVRKKKKQKRKFVSDLCPLAGWIQFLKHYNLIKRGKRHGLSIRDATVLFVYSKMGIVEEIENRFLFTHSESDD